MSGGALDHIYSRVEEAASRVLSEGHSRKMPYLTAFGKHLVKVATALRECEWFLSGDSGPEDAIRGIQIVVTRTELVESAVQALKEAISSAEKVLTELEKR